MKTSIRYVKEKAKEKRVRRREREGRRRERRDTWAKEIERVA